MRPQCLTLNEADLGSMNQRELNRVARELNEAVLVMDGGVLEIEIKAERGGASLLGILVTANAIAKERGGRLRVRNPRWLISELLHVARLGFLVCRD